MTDIERVISHLQVIHTWATVDGQSGRGIDPKSCSRIVEWVDDALDMLKTQQPRVMTLEEALGGDECWIEGRSGACGYGDALLTGDGERVDFYRPHSIDTLDFYEYGLSWRCWTSRPTDEQREATPWKD